MLIRSNKRLLGDLMPNRKSAYHICFQIIASNIGINLNVLSKKIQEYSDHSRTLLFYIRPSDDFNIETLTSEN
jgi:hypothetical protein